MWLFRILFAFDALALLVLLYFFVEGLQYGPGPDYMVTWLPILAVPIAVVAGAWVLSGQGRRGLASVLLGLLAVPPFLYLLFLMLMVVMQPDFR
ncbi:hypothetical protein [Sphingobium nicotianae]|uniref:Osmoprotectant transporter permease n=1 Tax=Sphingobium nicotianae TaxID=2782607 RepID=A0A9X1DDG1_9SPHN|nr:hypothetical protein [Sphingobium nicotianae]MBT2188147.1 hypothetical protein [Sphingobium nicotianae]